MEDEPQLQQTTTAEKVMRDGTMRLEGTFEEITYHRGKQNLQKSRQ